MQNWKTRKLLTNYQNEERVSPMKSCVLAYSGGLDTSVLVGWLMDEGFEVHCVYVDLGQPCEDREAILQKAAEDRGEVGAGRSMRGRNFAAISPFPCSSGRRSTKGCICWARRSPGR